MLVVALLPLLTLVDAGGSNILLVECVERTQLFEDAIVNLPNYGLLEITHN